MVTTTKLPLVGFDPIQFFRKLSADEPSPAYMTSGSWVVLAWDPVETMVGRDIVVLQRAKKLQRKHRTHANKNLPFLGGVIGWVSYDAGLRLHGIKSRHKKTSAIPDVCFHRYQHALLFDGRSVFAVGDAAFRRRATAIHARPLPPSRSHHPDWTATMSTKEYASAFKAIQKRIKDGDVYQLNLSYAFSAITHMDSRQLFCDLLTHHAAPAVSYVEHGKSALLSVSPERFVQIRRGRITTCPIKGTRPRGRTATEDKKMMRELLRDPKETAELNMITDLLRNDVGQVAVTGSVRVKEHRALQKNPSVWHTYSVVEGRLRPKVHPLDAFLSMFPGGSVTGCPKIAAMEDIDALETQARGLYCGSVVLLSDDGSLDSSIIIRSIEKTGSQLKLGVGGGIVSDSVCEKEEDETLRKAARILSLPARRTWANDKETDERAVLAALDPKNPSARGVFETMMATNGRFHSLAAHMRRLQSSAAQMEMTLSAKTMPRVQAFLKKAAELSGGMSLRVKIILTEKDVLMETRPFLVDAASVAGVTVTVTRLERKHPTAKALPYHREWRAYTDAVAQGYHEALLLRKDGAVPEAALSNVFFVKNGVLHTAKTDMLPGITRARVLTIARKNDMPVIFCMPFLHDLKSADEVFLTRSTVGIVPVTSINKFMVGSGHVGRITKALSCMLPW